MEGKRKMEREGKRKLEWKKGKRIMDREQKGEKKIK